MQAQDPLEEIDLGDAMTKSPTYISVKLDLSLKKVMEMLKEFKDCLGWDYHKMSKLSRDLV